MCSIVLFYDENIWMLPSIIVDMKDIQSKIKFALNNIKKISAFNPLLFDKSNNSRNLIIEVYLTLSFIIKIGISLNNWLFYCCKYGNLCLAVKKKTWASHSVGKTLTY